MMKIVDVSTFQGEIDWNTAKHHIDGAIIRCGYGDDDVSQDDKYFERNISECERLNIPHGIYLYSYASTEAHMQSEVKHILRLVKGRKLQFPIYIDLEDASLRPHFNAKLFCKMGQQMEDAGYWFGVYANLDWFRNTIGNSLDRFTRWVAQYNTTLDTYGDMWQYTSQGSVPGIGTGCVDMNKCYRDFPTEIEKKALSSAASSSTLSAPSSAAGMGKKSVEAVAGEVIAGKWGNSSEREKRLKTAGYNYEEVQSRVNKMMERPEYYKIQPNDTLSEIAARYGTTYQALAALNGITNPDIIYAGEVIRVK